MTIDWWTLGFQTVNVVVLIWLLQRFFWRPLAAVIAQRQVSAKAVMAEVQAQRDVAASALAGVEKTRAGFDTERDGVLAAAHAQADKASAASLDAAKQAAAALEAAAKASIAKEQAAAEQTWRDRASLLAVDMARHLAARLDGAVVRATFLDWLVKAIRALPEATRQAALAKGAVLDVISATPLDPADLEHMREVIGKAFAGHPQIDFKTDPALIAGLELHSQHLTVSNSWQADLGTFLEDLTHDRRH
jgi:F-type H+-transporting ATPase subunit b